VLANLTLQTPISLSLYYIMSSTIYASGTELVHAFVAGLNAYDLSTLKAMLSEDAQHEFLPKSLGRPSTKAAEALAMFGFLKQMVPNFQV
jgi:hypothetical protein